MRFYYFFPWIIRFITVFNITMSLLLVQFITFLDDDNLYSVSTQQVIDKLSSLDLIWLFRLPEFLTISTQHNNWNWQDISLLLSPFSALSLAIFSSGLYIYSRAVGNLKSNCIPLYFVLMGWAHLLLAKCILLIDLPNTLVGPVLSVGVLSVSYFSIAALIIDAYLLRKDKNRT